MLKKDYIQRYLDELTKMIAKVLQLKLNNEPEKANEELDQFGEDYLNINISDLIESNLEKVIDELISKHHFEVTHFKILEEILYQKHLLSPNNTKLKSLTLIILEFTTKTDKDFSIERTNRIKQLS